MSPEPIQRSMAELRRMPPEEISRALHAGELAEVLAGRDPGTASDPGVGTAPAGADQGARGERPVGQITDASELKRMTPQQIHEMTTPR